MHDAGNLEQYELPVLSSRRGVIQGLLLLTGVYGALYAAIGSPRFADGIVIGLFAVLLLIATMPLVRLTGPVTRLIVMAPMYVPLFIGAASASSTATGLAFAVFGFEVLVFGFLFLQSGTAAVTVRGVQRRRLALTALSFDEISGVKRYESLFGKLVHELGLATASVELLLTSWKTVRLNVAPADIDAFIAAVEAEINTTGEYDLFYTPQAPRTVVIIDGVEQEVKPLRRRGKKAKKRANQEKAAPQSPSAAR